MSGYVPPVVQRRHGFDPAKCTPEQWAALVWLVKHFEGMGAFIGPEKWREVEKEIKVSSARISADDPRTGDCVELPPDHQDQVGRRVYFVRVDPSRVLADPVAWNRLCRLPGATLHLAGSV